MRPRTHPARAVGRQPEILRTDTHLLQPRLLQPAHCVRRTESAVLSGAFRNLGLFEQFQTSLPHSPAPLNGAETLYRIRYTLLQSPILFNSNA